jgi:hypothetical protein
LLIDEPECHLHPTLQTKLTRELRERVAEIGSTALITTHSPFVARGLPLGSNVVWVKPGGSTEARESELIKKLLGWGALDKPVLFCTEESNTNQLEQILSQIPSLENFVSVFPFNGVSKLGTGSVLAGVREKLGNTHKVIVHRDRDGMTDSETEDWKSEYSKFDIIPWVTDGSDIESYFCEPGYLAALFNISFEQAESIITACRIETEETMRAKFGEKRKQINKRYEKSGGSPVTDDLIAQWPFHRWVKGKEFISTIRRVVRDLGIGDEKLIGRGVESYVVSPDLMRILYGMTH